MDGDPEGMNGTARDHLRMNRIVPWLPMNMYDTDPRRPLLMATCLAMALLVNAQTPFLLTGVVKEHDGRTVMPGVTIIATDTLSKSGTGARVSIRTDKRGKYRLSLPYDNVFNVEYWAQGHVAKRVIIDLTDVREKFQEGGNTMDLEISLFKVLGKVDYSACKAPVAICRFDRGEKKFIWDKEYSAQRDAQLDTVEKQHLAVMRAGRSMP